MCGVLAATHQCSSVRSPGSSVPLSVILAVAAGVLTFAEAASPPSQFDVLHAFASQGAINPSASLIQATDGNFYGTTSSGDASGNGTVFRMIPGGTVTVLHAFAGGTTDGANPQAALIQATDGNFYGTTSSGGPSDNGTVFRMTPSGTVTILHAFAGGTTDGANPRAALIQATDGNFYGTTSSGGTFAFGTVFRMTPGGALTILYAFTDGLTGGVPGAPYASLIQATDGDFYGTTVAFQGIHVAYGTIFKMTPGGTVAVLNDLASYASLIQATDGNFYGTTVSGLLSPQEWTAFKMTSSGTVTILASNVGAGQAALVQATDGNFYGTSEGGGAFSSGTAFQMTPSGSITVLHAFTGGADGASPAASLIQATDGDFYGTTYSGGASGTGVVFRLGPHAAPARDGDFDGDGKADITVYRPSSGGWYVLRSSTGYTTYGTYMWGLPADVPVRGDFDGDGKEDIAVYRPSNGGWYILQSSTDYTTYVSYLWGLPGDVPVPGDYDGDGKTDIAVDRPSNGTWYILQSSTGYTTYTAHAWGIGGDMPVPADYDGDGKTDIAAYRPSTGTWYILPSSTNDTTYVSYVWGLAGDVPVQADYDGDGKVDPAVYRPSNGGWYFLRSSTSYTTYGSYLWGLTGDMPVVGDFDGDGKADVAVYRPSNGGWYILQSSTNYTTYVSYLWGLGGDVPLLKRP
jgi:uncharacterized repeat protein (TIGR03803 family)